uniref:RRM domain-containing protein n=1 Tax=Macrostomum lignano TaxID=282301 RepID=A0A1I8F7J7_9PLAT
MALFEYVAVALEDEGGPTRIEVPTEAARKSCLPVHPGRAVPRPHRPCATATRTPAAMRAVRPHGGRCRTVPAPEFNSWSSQRPTCDLLCAPFPKTTNGKVDEELGRRARLPAEEAATGKKWHRPRDVCSACLTKPTKEGFERAAISHQCSASWSCRRSMPSGTLAGRQSAATGFIRTAVCEREGADQPGRAGRPGQRASRVFVGGITEEMTSQVLKDFFNQHGTVEEVYIPKPFRNFAFVTFADSTTVDRLVGQDFDIEGTTVHVGHRDSEARREPRLFGVAAWARCEAAGVAATRWDHREAVAGSQWAGGGGGGGGGWPRRRPDRFGGGAPGGLRGLSGCGERPGLESAGSGGRPGPGDKHWQQAARVATGGGGGAPV